MDAIHKPLAAIDAAKQNGMDPVKVNAVIVRGRNDDEIVDFARFARETRMSSFRFIEFMPLDSGHEWSRDMVVSGREIRDRIKAVYPLKLKEASRGTGTAWKYEFADGSRRVRSGSSLPSRRCSAGNAHASDSPPMVRSAHVFFQRPSTTCVTCSAPEHRDEEIAEFIRSVVLKKEPRHHINDADFVQPARTMSFIGG